MARVCEEWFPIGSYPNQRQAGFFMDDGIKQQVDVCIKNITKDWDFTIIITGGGQVRVGKSVLAMQIGAYWTYQIEHVHGIKVPFDKDNFIFQWDKLIETGNKFGGKYKYCCLIYDEAGETMEGTKSATMELRAVKDYLRECGQYNFLTILVMPEFFDLPKGIALTRSICLIDVAYKSTEDGVFERGYFKFYSKKKKKMLYLKGKKELNYNVVPYNFEGRFYNVYPIDEEAYRNQKIEALRDRESTSKDKTKILAQTLTFILYKLGYKVEDVVSEVQLLNKGISLFSRMSAYRYIKAYDMEKPGYVPGITPN